MSSFAALDCANIRRCSSQLDKFELKVATCLADQRTYSCQSTIRDPEQRTHLRKCTVESECEEQETWLAKDDVFPGCTGLTLEKRQGMIAAAREMLADDRSCMSTKGDACATNWFGSKAIQLYNIGWAIDKGIYGLFVGAANFGTRAGNGDLHPIRYVQEKWSDSRRRWACLDNMGKYRLMCERAGGVFEAALITGAVRKSIAEAVIEQSGRNRVRRLVARESVIADKSVGGQVRARLAAGSKTGAAALNSIAVAAAMRAGTRPTETATAPERVQATSEVLARENRQREGYIRGLIGRQNTTVEQRRAFAELAFKAEARGDMVFVDMQNSKMKYLNDHLGDKNIVTAITNARIQATFDELRAKYPQLDKIEYDDFKSARIGFKFKDGKIPAGFLDDLRKSLSSAEDKFIAELGEFDVVPKGSDLLPPDKWFAAGTGLTADEANLACRYAARTCGGVVDFRSSRVLQNLGGRLSQTETLRSGTMKALRNTEGLTKTLPNGQVIPTTPVYEAYRKAESVQEFQKMIFERTRQSISMQTAVNLRNYLKQLDEWSTGLLLVEKRQSVSFVGSKYNGVTIDVSGMGALNMEKLAGALAGETDVMEAMPKARRAEREATAEFERNKQAIVDAAQASLRSRGIEVDVRVSGDDIIVLPTTRALDAEAMSALQEAVAKSPSSSNVRLSAVTSGAKSADQLAVAGETIEKKVRGLTLRSVDDQSRYTLMVVTDNAGQPTLHVAARSGEVSAEVDQAYQAAFREAIAK